MSTVDPTCGSRQSFRFDAGHLKSHPESEVLFPTQFPNDRFGCEPSNYFRFKAIFEWCFVVSLLAIVLPVLGLIAICLLVFEGLPVFYRQVRVGKDQKQFYIWKFRTMRPDAEKDTGPVWSSRKDVRVTRLGRWLRATHLDELPQVFNVLGGDMHLVGPRPERPEFVESLVQDIPGYNRRHLVRPGITGLAQVKQGYDSCVGDVASKVAFDVAYIRSASLFTDLKILVQTIPYVIGEVGTVLRRKMQKAKGNASTEKSVETAEDPEICLGIQIQHELNAQIETIQKVSTSGTRVPKPKLATASKGHVAEHSVVGHGQSLQVYQPNRSNPTDSAPDSAR